MVVVFPERAADERRAHARQRLDGVVALVHVRDDLVGGEGVVVVVLAGVVHQLVSARDDGFRRVGVLLRPRAHDEERRLDAVLVQHVEDALRVVGTPRGVERDRADLLVARDAVDGKLPLCRGGADGGGRGVHRGEDGDRRERRAEQRDAAGVEDDEADTHRKSPPTSRLRQTMREGLGAMRAEAAITD